MFCGSVFVRCQASGFCCLPAALRFKLISCHAWPKFLTCNDGGFYDLLSYSNPDAVELASAAGLLPADAIYKCSWADGSLLRLFPGQISPDNAEPCNSPLRSNLLIE